MKIVVGLGNPGKNYEETRHNVGFKVLELLFSEEKLKPKLKKEFNAKIVETVYQGGKAIFVMPLTYMNLSGNAVSMIMKYYNADFDDLLVVVDDVNIPFGNLRLREHGNSGGHNGLKDITEKLGSNKYKRLRIGVGSNNGQELDQFVLGKFSKAEKKEIALSFEKAKDAIIEFVNGYPYLDIMTKYNSKK